MTFIPLRSITRSAAPVRAAGRLMPALLLFENVRDIALIVDKIVTREANFNALTMRCATDSPLQEQIFGYIMDFGDRMTDRQLGQAWALMLKTHDESRREEAGRVRAIRGR